MAGNYGSNKEQAEIFRKLEKQGWRIEQSRGAHFSCYSPDGKTIVRAGGTPSDVRAIKNFKAALRRAGADV